MIHIRSFQISDINEITELMTDLGYPIDVKTMENRIKNIEKNKLYKTFVALLNNKIVGMVGLRQVMSYESDNLTAQITALVTKQEFRNQGIGKTLVNYAEYWARENGSSIIFLTSGNRTERIKAHKFYENMGFKNTGFRFSKNLE